MDIDDEIKSIESLAVMVGLTNSELHGTKLERVLRPQSEPYAEPAPDEPVVWWRLSVGGMDEEIFSVTKKTIEDVIAEARRQLTDLNVYQIKAAEGNRKKAKKSRS